ncbi:MAG: hypothetical protein ACYDAO_07335 [Thermoplasmataceae archaeon]
MQLLISPKRIAGANIASEIIHEGVYRDKEQLRRILNPIKNKNHGLYDSIIEALKEHDISL